MGTELLGHGVEEHRGGRDPDGEEDIQKRFSLSSNMIPKHVNTICES